MKLDRLVPERHHLRLPWPSIALHTLSLLIVASFFWTQFLQPTIQLPKYQPQAVCAQTKIDQQESAATPVSASAAVQSTRVSPPEELTSVASSSAVSPASSQVFVPFTATPLLESLRPSENSSRAWENLRETDPGQIAQGVLYVRKNDTERNLQPKDDEVGPPNSISWGISMFHGLHCLQMVRELLVEKLDEVETLFNSNEVERDGKRRRGRVENIQERYGHIGHCFGYLAQSLLCSGDTTIERPYFTFNPDGSVHEVIVDGEGVFHQCRDTSKVFEAALSSQKEPVAGYIREKWNIGMTVEELLDI